MKRIVVILFLIAGGCTGREKILFMSQPVQKLHTYHYLALGDSYTIGELVPPDENFPNQVFSMMKNESIDFQPPRIIARTGWTTDELEDGILAAIQEDPLRPAYDFVSLLIGVNDQYRGRPVENYKPGFEKLLKKAIAYVGNRPGRVVVLSIPDWGVTPFAEGRDRVQIAKEIDMYNAANKQLSDQYKLHYINITPWTREAANDHSLLTSDGLHPSSAEYKRWAGQLAILFKQWVK